MTDIAVKAQALKTMEWILDARNYPYDDRAKLLNRLQVIRAAEFYKKDNRLGLLMVSGFTPEQFEKRIVEMKGALPAHWCKWREK